MLKRRSGQEWSENKGIVCRLPPSYKPVFVLFLSGSFPEKFYWTQSFYMDSNGQMVNGDITASLIWSMIRLYLHLWQSGFFGLIFWFPEKKYIFTFLGSLSASRTAVWPRHPIIITMTMMSIVMIMGWWSWWWWWCKGGWPPKSDEDGGEGEDGVGDDNNDDDDDDDDFKFWH